MNRRGFLSLFGVAASGLILPEPCRIYSFPSSEYLAAFEKLKKDTERDVLDILGREQKIPYTTTGIAQVKEAAARTFKVYDFENAELFFNFNRHRIVV